MTAPVAPAAPGYPVKQRAHARRNLARVVAAADAIFTARGLSASVPDIAALAGVGKATVYRSFPTKAALVAAVASSRLDWLVDRLELALTLPDAWPALTAALEDIVVRSAADHCLSDAVRSGAVPEAAPRLERTHRAIDTLVERAQAAGDCRRDASGADLRALLTGCIQYVRRDGGGDPAQSRRYARLLLDALRPSVSP